MHSLTIMTVLLCVLFLLTLNVAHCSKFPFVPTHYDIQIRPILDPCEEVGPTNTAPGTVKIFGITKTQTALISLYIYDLQIQLSSLKVYSLTSDLNVSNVSIINEGKEVLIQLSRDTDADENLQISMQYVAKIGKWNGGLVYEKHKSEHGIDSVIVGTRFQKEDRWNSNVKFWRVFPCVEVVNYDNLKDDVLPKSTFNLTIIRKENWNSVANTEIISSSPDPNHEGWIVDKYSRTRGLTPVELSFAVFSNYTTITAESNKTLIGVHGPTDFLEDGSGDYALEFGTQIMNFFCEYLNSSVEMKTLKMDFVIVPENVYYGLNFWGISYFPPKSATGTVLLWSGNSTKSRIVAATNVALTLAMHWVQPAGDQNCLSNGIRLQLKQLAMIQSPDMPLIVANTIYYLQYKQQALYNTNQKFYKSWIITQMVEDTFGPSNFQTFMQSYIQQANYNNDDITDQEVVEILQEISPKLAEALLSWCEQPGFPLVKVEVLNESHVILKQEPFKTGEKNIAENITWDIPIRIKNNLSDDIYWINNETDLIVEHNTSTWILLNSNVKGYYRVHYELELYQKIHKELSANATTFSPIFKAQLIDDYFSFAENGYISIQTALNFTEYLEQETEIVVWQTLLSHLESVRYKLSSHPTGHSAFMEYIHKRLDTMARNMGFQDMDGEAPFQTNFRREYLLSWACEFGKPTPYCVEEASKLLAEWIEHPANISVPSRQLLKAISCAAAAEGGRQAFELLYERYKKAGFGDEENIMTAIACTRDPEVIRELFNKTRGNVQFTWDRLIDNPVGIVEFLPFLRKNIGHVLNMFTREQNAESRNVLARKRAGMMIAEKIVYASRRFVLEEQINEVEAFLMDNNDRFENATMNYIVSRISRDNVEWMETTGKQILDWMKSQI